MTAPVCAPPALSWNLTVFVCHRTAIPAQEIRNLIEYLTRIMYEYLIQYLTVDR